MYKFHLKMYFDWNLIQKINVLKYHWNNWIEIELENQKKKEIVLEFISKLVVFIRIWTSG